VIYSDYISKEIVDRYEVHDYRHAAAILANEFPTEFREICSALSKFFITRDDIIKPGGNESNIPKKLSAILRPIGWEEKKLEAKMVADSVEAQYPTLFKTPTLSTVSEDCLV
jgi:CRISPR-associated protein Csd2